MRKIALFGLIVFLAAVCQASSLPPILDTSKIFERTLPNGLQLVIKEERQWPVVAIGLYIRAGSLYERPQEAGAAHLVEHLLFEATGDDAQKLAPFVESMGGRINASTLRDFVHVDVLMASPFIERVLPVLLEAVFKAQFTEQQFKRELAVVKREIADRRERVDVYLDELLWRLAYDTHPYGRPIGGTETDVERLTYDTVRQFYRRFYVPNNAALIVVGDVDPMWLEGRVRQLTADVKARELHWQEPPLDPPLTQTRVKAETLQRPLSVLAFGWRAVGIEDKPTVCALDLIYTLLGQGAVGRLNTRLVKEEKVLLSAEVEFLTQKYPGLFIINAVVPPGREEEAQIAILKEVQRLAEEPLSEQELERAKRLLYAEYAFTNETYDDQAGSLGFYASIDNYRFALDYIAHVMQITPEQIQDTARRLLRRDNYALVILRGQKGEEAPETAAMRL